VIYHALLVETVVIALVINVLDNDGSSATRKADEGLKVFVPAINVSIFQTILDNKICKQPHGLSRYLHARGSPEVGLRRIGDVVWGLFSILRSKSHVETHP